MTLQQLKYALTIADCGSMNEAAKQLFISQPSLSETMKELETEIGLIFFCVQTVESSSRRRAKNFWDMPDR